MKTEGKKDREKMSGKKCRFLLHPESFKIQFSSICSILEGLKYFKATLNFSAVLDQKILLM